MIGNYDQATADRMNLLSFKQGQNSMLKRLVLTYVAVFLIGLGFSSIINLPNGKPSTVANTPELATLIGSFRNVKDNSEQMVRSVKARWLAGKLSNEAYNQCSTYYRELSSQFNGAMVTLEAMVSTGYNETTAAFLNARLNEAQQSYSQFRLWFNSLPIQSPAKPKSSRYTKSSTQQTYSAVADFVPVIWDLAKHVLTTLAQMEKERKEHLIRLLREQQFQSWSDLTEP